MKQAYFFVFLVLMLSNATMMAQLKEHPVRVFAKETGFQYDLKKIVQDKNDFIWVMYSESIQRFDGKNMDTYFKGSVIYSLINDRQGNIWVSSEEGVFLFDPHKNSFDEIATEDDKYPIKLLFEFEEDKAAYVNKAGIYIYNTEKKAFSLELPLFNTLTKSPRIRPGFFSNSGQSLYYTVVDTIFRYSLKTGTKDFQLFTLIRGVMALSENEIVVSNWENKSWYYNYITKKKIPLNTADSEAFFIVFDVLHKGGSEYYLATFTGLYLFDTASESLEKVSLSLDGKPFPQQRYNALFKGKDNTIWAGLENSLLYFNDSDKTFHFVKSHSGSTHFEFTSDVRNFAEDKKGNLWLATANGLTYWEVDKGNFSTLFAKDGADDWLNHASIRGLIYDGIYLIIGQTNKGMWLYEPESGVFKRPKFENSDEGSPLQQKMERDFINQIKTLKNGDHLIVARDGAYILNGKTYVVKALDFPGAGFNVKFSYQDQKGNIFIGTLKGLYCLDAAYNFQYKIEDELENPQTFTLLEHGNKYYLGTRKGLYVFSIKNELPEVKKILPDLDDSWVKTIFKDSLDRIWIVADSKIYAHHPVEKTLSAYGPAENIRGDFYYSNSYHRNADGTLFLGGTNGITFFYPEKIEIRSTILKPVIKSVRLPERNLQLDLFKIKSRVKNRFRNLEIDFTAPYYGDSRDIYFKYKLTKNGPWYHHENQSRLMLWELPPGDYEFQVAASRNKEKWFPAQNSFHFSIAPPFWQNGWFIFASIIIMGFLLYSVIKSFKEKLKIEKIANAFATSLYGQNTVEGILWDIARNCVSLLGFKDCVVYVIDRKRGLLIQKAAFGPKNPYGKEITNLMEIPLGKGIVGSVAKNGKPELIKNTNKDTRYLFDYQQAQSEITVPIFVDGNVFAVIDSEHPKQNYYKPFHLKILLKIAGICAERITKYLSEENLRAKIARDLHDEMGSTLTSINITSKIAEQDIVNNDQVKKQLKKINLHTKGMMEKMSDMVWVINPANDNFNKVIYRIKEYAVEVSEPANISLSFSGMKGAEYVKLNPEQRKNIYMIAKEALNNIVKYSEATQINLTFETTPQHRLKMSITDNGKGYDPDEIKPGNGIKNMYFRAEEIQAGLIVKTSTGAGTSICLILPQEIALDCV